MTDETVFNSNIDKLKNLKFEKGLVSDFLSWIGKGSISEEALTAHNNFIDKTIQSYTDNMNALLKLTKQMEQEGLNNNVRMERMSDHINKLENTIKAQTQDIINSNNIILNHKNTIDGLKTQNEIFKQANQTLTSQNERQQKQNEEQNTTNQKLTSQNKAQQEQIANLDNILKGLKNQLESQATNITEQTKKIKEITNSNDELSEKIKQLEATQINTEINAKKAAAEFNRIIQKQEKDIKDINAAQKIKVLFLKNSAKNKLKLQGKAFLNRIAEIKENSDKSIADKEAKIKEITEQHTKAQNEINTQLTNLEATSNATIGDLKKELSSFKTEEKLSKEDQEKQKKMLNTVTRVFPLSWKNSKGFNIGNITTQVRGNKPYHANDTIDYYLHTLFKGKTPIGKPRDIISSKQVPIRGILKETSGGKKNRMKKSKKSNKSKNNKTKKQRGKR